MTDTEGMSPPKYIAKHWPKQSERELIEEFLEFVADPENGGAELRHRIRVPAADPRSGWVWEEAPLPELLESFFNAREMS